MHTHFVHKVTEKNQRKHGKTQGKAFKVPPLVIPNHPGSTKKSTAFKTVSKLDLSI